MKQMKDIFIALLAAIVLPLGFTACTNNDNPIVPFEDEPDVPYVFDAPRFFQLAIVSCEEDGSGFEGFHWGKELYPETDPGHLYIGVDTWEEAERMFRRYWLAPNVNPSLLSPSELALKAPLTGRDGVEQMQVYLKPGETDDVVAELTLSDDSQMKHFYKITFLKNEAWPEEQGARTRASKKKYKWHVGDVVKNVTLTVEDDNEDYLDDDDKQLDFVCIRSASNGVKPWFASVTVHNTYKCGNPSLYPTYQHVRRFKYVPDYDTACQVDSIMKDNWNLIKNAWSECSDIGDFPGTCSNNEPFIDSCHESSAVHNKDTYNFDSSEIIGVKAGNRAPFFFEFDLYEDDEVEDGMTAYRTIRSKCTNQEGSRCNQCTN